MDKAREVYMLSNFRIAQFEYFWWSLYHRDGLQLPCNWPWGDLGQGDIRAWCSSSLMKEIMGVWTLDWLIVYQKCAGREFVCYLQEVSNTERGCLFSIKSANARESKIQKRENITNTISKAAPYSVHFTSELPSFVS